MIYIYSFCWAAGYRYRVLYSLSAHKFLILMDACDHIHTLWAGDVHIYTLASALWCISGVYLYQLYMRACKLHGAMIKPCIELYVI